jgi:hypothetical protein
VGRVPEAKSSNEFAISLCAAIAGALTLAIAWYRADAARHGGAALAMAAAAALLLTPLFAPRAAPIGRACWCALLVAACTVGALILAVPDWSWPALLLTAITAFAWSVAIAWAASLGTAAGGRADTGEAMRWAVLAVVLLLAFAPVWAGPALAQVGSDSRLARALLAANPLVAVSSAAGYDVLHSPWFYRHSVLGSLRLRYPGAAEIAVIDAILLLIPVLVPPLSARREPVYPKTHLETLL